MVWPLSQDYNEAIQNPLTSFRDPDLRQGQVVTNALGLPQPCSGNFADVYAVECPATGTKWAVKCFTREVHGLRERYSAISSHLRQVRLRFTVDFDFLEEGIRVAGRWYPVLKMRWVEGFTLNTFVRDMLDRPATLEALARIWLRMAWRLGESRLAHGDLQHGNVLLVPGRTDSSLAVKLIDYDGMWVPALAQTPSGEVGHAAYQHPQRLRESIYGPDVDRFPLLAIYCALRALAIGGRSLWERHDTGDNLLFQQSDFQTPTRSPLMAELLRMNNPEVPFMMGALIDAARSPLDQVPTLASLVPGEVTTSSQGSKTTLRPVRTTVLSAAELAEPEADEPSVFAGIEPESMPEVSRFREKRHARRSAWVWFVGASLAAGLLLGGGLKLVSTLRTSKKRAEAEYAQAQIEATVSLKPVETTSNSSPEDRPPPLLRETLPDTTAEPPKTPSVLSEPVDPRAGSTPPSRPLPSVKPEEKPADSPKDSPKPPPAEPPPDTPKPILNPRPEEKPAVPEKPSAPDKPTLEKATADIREIYKTDYVSRKPEDQVFLAGKLLKRGMANEEEAGRRFAYLSEARDLAARGGDFALCFRAIDEIIKAFAVNPLSVKTHGVERAILGLRTANAAKSLTMQTLEIVDEAEAANDYDEALKLTGLAQKAAGKSADIFLGNLVSQHKARLERLRKDYAKIVEAVGTLAAKPADPEANLIVGRFQCLVKEDWERGLPLLVQGAEAELAELARKEIESPEDTTARVALGQAWLTFADKQNDAALKTAGQRRGRYWLRAVLPSVTGEDAERIAAQLEVKKGSVRFRPGLVTELFAGENFERRVRTRIDYKLYFDWGMAAPDKDVPPDHFSIRWQGWLTPPRPGKYTFAIVADDGARLFIDGQSIIDCWKQPRVEDRHTKVIDLLAKPYPLRLEYREWFGPAYFHLLWSLEHGFPEQPISLEWLSHDLNQERLLTP
jgi:hypothetical protein